MKLHPKNGVDKLLFGMKQKDVLALYGEPEKQYNDDDENIIFLYYQYKLRLTFYEEEDFRLGYIITSNENTTLLDKKVMGVNIAQLKADLPFNSWEVETYDSTENHFNESNWLTLQSEFDSVIRIELGAIIKDMDEFDWKFKS
jgi:hypothetical protein